MAIFVTPTTPAVDRNGNLAHEWREAFEWLERVSVAVSALSTTSGGTLAQVESNINAVITALKDG